MIVIDVGCALSKRYDHCCDLVQARWYHSQGIYFTLKLLKKWVYFELDKNIGMYSFEKFRNVTKKNQQF